MWRTTCVMVLLASCIVLNSATAQNPFDLKWRTKAGKSDTARLIEPDAPRPPTAIIETLQVEETDVDIDTPTLTVDSFSDANLVVDDSTALHGGDQENVEALSGSSEDPEMDIVENYPIRETSSNPREPVKAALIIVMIGLAILILTWSVNYNRGFIKQIYRAAMNENLSSLLLREQRFASSQYLYYIVYITFFINAALFLYLTVRKSTWDMPYTSAPLLYFLFFVLAVYLIKHVIIKFLGSSFEIAEKTAHYNFTILLFNILAGIALIPINLLLAFGSASLATPVIIIGLIILSLLYLLRQFRGLMIVSDTLGGNGFQFFMYLCAIEILPILVLFKFFTTH